MKKSNIAENTVDHHPQEEYFVTQTLSEHLNAFANIGLEIPDEKFIQEMEDVLVASLKDIFRNNGDVQINVIPVREQCHAITSSVNRLKKRLRNPVVLSTCPLLSFGADGRLLHLSRLINIDGNIIAIGPRPCHDLPPQQITDIHHDICDREVILVEDGAFTGSTLMYTLELLREHKARVEAIVLGVLFPEAEQRIRSVFKGDLVCCIQPKKPLDWMPSHDFFPFLPNAGRVIGHKLGGVAMPVYLNYDKAAIAVPYVLPYGKPDWSSLPGNKSALNRFSLSCLYSAAGLFREMERKRGEPLRVGDVLGSSPATYIPASCGDQSGFTHEKEEIVRIIELDCELLS